MGSPDPPVPPKAHSKPSKQPRLQLDDVDEFGRRLRRGSSDASETVEVEKATGLATKMSEKQQAALARLQNRGKIRLEHRSRSPLGKASPPPRRFLVLE